MKNGSDDSFAFIEELKRGLAAQRDSRRRLIEQELHGISDAEARERRLSVEKKLEDGIKDLQHKAACEYNFDFEAGRFLNSTAQASCVQSDSFQLIVVHWMRLTLVLNRLRHVIAVEETKAPRPSEKLIYRKAATAALDLYDCLTACSIDHILSGLEESSEEFAGLRREWTSSWIASHIRLDSQYRFTRVIRSLRSGKQGRDLIVGILCEVDRCMQAVSSLEDYSRLPEEIEKAVTETLTPSSDLIGNQNYVLQSIEQLEEIGVECAALAYEEEFMAREIAQIDAQDRLQGLEEFRKMFKNEDEWRVFLTEALAPGKRPTSAVTARILGTSPEMVRHYRQTAKRKLLEFRRKYQAKEN